MRTFWDRVRHTIIFEVIAILVVAFAGGWILNRPAEELGVLSLIMSALAMGWNMLYNWLFDLWDRKYRQLSPRGLKLRVVHATLFEAGMLTAGIFVVMWWLEMGFMEALFLDIGFAVFFLIYAFLYNLGYDRVFPTPIPGIPS